MSTYTPDGTQGDGEVRCPWDGCDESYDSERIMKVHHKAAHGESIADRPNQVERRNPDDGIPCPWDGCDRAFRNELGRQQHHAKTHGESIRGVELECDECGEPFRINKQRAEDENLGRFCSRECTAEWRTGRIAGEDHPCWNRAELTCEWCGETYTIRQSEADRSRFCSKDCKDGHHSEAMRGDSNPIWKEKVTLSCQYCGGDFDVWPSIADVRTHCSTECMGKWQSENRVGEDAPGWNGGHDGYYGPEWQRQRRKALERDGYECRICGMTNDDHLRMNGKSLEVHHVIPRREFDDIEAADDLDNLVTVCMKHHKQWEGVPVFPGE